MWSATAWWLIGIRIGNEAPVRVNAMKTALVGLFPELARAALAVGVLGRAVRDGRLECALINPRDHADDSRKTVDDRPFGGGPGMVMTVTPLRRAVGEARAFAPSGAPVILLTPQGERFDQRVAGDLAATPGFVLVAGRYEGVDERFVIAEVDREVSLGDFVLSGGELAALAVLDAVARLLPGALGNPDSATQESHVDGLLDHPHYTRPETCAGMAAPPVLVSGDHARVARWRRREALRRTLERRPDLLLDRDIPASDRALLADCLEQDVA